MPKKFHYSTFSKYFKSYLNTSINSFHPWNFSLKLLISYYIVIAVCIFSMGILSYSFVSTSIREQAAISNDKLLNQFKNTVDNLVLRTINDVSLNILRDTYANPYISYYFSEDLSKNIYDLVKVMEYCSTIKSVNSMLFSAGIYFERNQLLVSSEGVRTTFYGKMSDQENLQYYYDLIYNSNSTTSWHIKNNYTVDSFNSGLSVHNIIHMIRKVPGVGNKNPGGAIVISIDEDVFYNVIKETAAPDLDKIIICDNQGSIISHSDKELLGQNITGYDYGVRIINTPAVSDNYIVNIDDIPSVVSFCSSNYNDWKYITITPIYKLNAVSEFILKTIIFVALATILFGLLISLIPALQLSNPLKRLVDFCKGVSKSPELTHKNEYNLIQSTIEKLAFNMHELELKFIDVLPVLKENFTRDLISQHHINGDRDLEDRLRLLALSFPHTGFLTLAIHVKKTDDPDAPLIREYEKINIAAALEKNFNTDIATCLHCEKDGNTAAIINFSTDVQIIYDMINSLMGQKEFDLPDRLFIGIGTAVHNMADIRRSYSVAEAGLRYRYIFPENHIFLSGDIMRLEEGNTPFGKRESGNLAAFLQARNRGKVLNEIDQIIIACKTGKYSYANIMDTLSLIVSAIQEASTKLGIVLDAGGNAADIDTQFAGIDNINAFKKWIFMVVDDLFDCIERRHSDINAEIVQKAADYIARNINGNQLSLQAVASELRISSSHLSRIFKRETGVTFVDYVADLKLYYSKDLLLKTSHKIDEISSMMGYSTPQYFISRFKIKYGYTPKEYRCKYASSVPE